MNPQEDERVKLIQRLSKQREKLFRRMNDCYKLAKELKISDHNAFLARYEKLGGIYESYDEIQNNIEDNIMMLGDAGKAYSQDSAAFDNMYFLVQETYLALQQALKKKAEASATTSSSQPQPVTFDRSNLPRLRLSTFDGEKTEEFSPFLALFDSLVHNTPLSNIEKFHYLKTCLEGKASSVISEIPLTANNYELAYTTLKEKYDCVRIQASHHLNKILSFKTLHKESLAGLKDFLQIFDTSVKAFKNLKLDHNNFTLFYIALQGLPLETRKTFESTQNDVPTYESLVEFINQRAKILEVSTTVSANETPQPHTKSSRGQATKLVMAVSAAENKVLPPCDLCKGSHKFIQCPSFLSLDVATRSSFAKKYGRCYVCLGKHFVKDCSSKGLCRVCNGKHHTLLHSPGGAKAPQVDSTNKLPTSSSENKLSASTFFVQKSTDDVTVVLGTAQILAFDAYGVAHLVRAVVDPGSQLNFVTSRCVQRLGLTKKRSSTAVSGISDAKVSSNKGFTEFEITPKDDRSLKFALQAIVLDEITPPLPTVKLDDDIKRHFDNLKLADDTFHKPSEIDVLLGGGIFPYLLKPQIPLLHGTPSAINTVFGWMVIGEAQIQKSPSPHTCLLSFAPLESQLKQFWQIEEINKSIPPNPEEEACENHFAKTHTRDSTGRYTVHLPFKNRSPLPISTREVAEKRLVSLERKLSKNRFLRVEYDKFLSDYETLGHMELAQQPSPFVIPHQAVLREASSTTKVRVVFDCSATVGYHSPSLNQQLMAGPRLQPDIGVILMKFRLFEVVLCADIKMMYRQIMLTPEHRQYQHIFWRGSPSQPILEYELKTVTYGATPSAFLAQRVLKQLAFDEGETLPRGAQVILENTFVDDLAFGGSSIEDAREVKNQVIELLARGQFELRKWVSNEPCLLEDILPENQAQHQSFDKVDSTSDCLKLLGLKYNPSRDTFSFTVQEPVSEPTKRGMLSIVARLFDPLGLCSPTVLWAKTLIQEAWKLQIDWDDPLPDNILLDWRKFVIQLPLLNELEIPRLIPALKSSVSVVGFCDASSIAYSAVIYLRCENSEGTKVQLLQAKTRVAPIKPLTIPKLELCGALLLSRLLKSLEDFLKTLDLLSKISLFSDSATVLAWLRTPPHTLKTFVAHRIVEILENTSPSFWRHVPSHLNPADISSRGLSPKALKENTLWWEGPSFLLDDPQTWPDSSLLEHSAPLPEVKTKTALAVVKELETVDFITRFSSLEVLIRVTCRILRWSPKSNRSKSPTEQLTISEREAALKRCVFASQKLYFKELVAALKSNRQLPRSYAKLAPFIDSLGLVRVGGRLRHSILPDETKFPLLLPRQAPLSSLICRFYHHVSLHGGAQLIQSLIQRKFWILGLRRLIKSQNRSCLKCYRFQGKPPQPKMADLPAIRFEQIRPFLNTTLDCAGPFKLKEHLRRNARIAKGYLILFVCLSTKAVHLELLSSLTTESLLMALDRFISRRGLCANIFSDRGTNLVGASNHLKEVATLIRDSAPEIVKLLTSKEIKWHFNPPQSPHFGGLHERMIREVKRHLIRTVGETPLTHEEMSTFFSKIEAILNSRPLGYVSNDPNDSVDYLTPGHFLVGSPLLVPPQPLDPDDLRLNQRFTLIHQNLRSFWNRWSKEYLQELQIRTKWTKNSPSLQENDIVIIKDVNAPPLIWPLGRVITTYPGPDQQVRVADVLIKGKTYQRAINRLLPLPHLD